MTYTIHYVWPWWNEHLIFRNAEEVKKWLTNGFQPEGCDIYVEDAGTCHKWNRQADYANSYRKAPLTKEFKKLFAQQEKAAQQKRSFWKLGVRKSV